MKLNSILLEAFGSKQMVAGDKVKAGYRSFMDDNEFLGFTDDTEQYGKGGVKFKTQKELLDFYKVSNLVDLEKLQDKKPYGYRSYMMFLSLEDKDKWYAYLYKGKWCVGTSSDRLKVAPSDVVSEQLVRPSVGNLGHVLVLDDNLLVKELAQALSVNDGWELTPVGNVFAAYNSGDRLAIFENADDFDAE